MKKAIFILISFIGFLITGCGGPRMASDITVFHALGQQEQEKTYAFVPLKGQKNSLEYRIYAGYIQKELGKYGYVLAPLSQASILVKFAYAIDNGRTMSGSVPVWGQTGISSSTTYGTANTYGQVSSYGNYSGTTYSSSTTTYTPSYGVTGYKNVSYVNYTRRLKVVFIDKKTKRSIYDAEVQSVGSTGQLGGVMPYMVKSLFKDFPGQSGSTKRIYMDVK